MRHSRFCCVSWAFERERSTATTFQTNLIQPAGKEDRISRSSQPAQSSDLKVDNLGFLASLKSIIARRSRGFCSTVSKVYSGAKSTRYHRFRVRVHRYRRAAEMGELATAVVIGGQVFSAARDWWVDAEDDEEDISWCKKLQGIQGNNPVYNWRRSRKYIHIIP